MAIRINVTTIRDCAPAENRAVVSEVIRPVCANAAARRLSTTKVNQQETWKSGYRFGISSSLGLQPISRPSSHRDLRFSLPIVR